MLNYDPFRIARAHLELWNNRNPEPYKELLAPAATLRFVFDKEEQPFMKAFALYDAIWHDAFPDVRWQHLDIIPADNTLTLEWVAMGTHMGTFMAVPPTGVFGKVYGTTVLKLNEDGKIVKETVYMDLNRILEQLGIMPPAARPEVLREKALAAFDALNRRDFVQFKALSVPDVRILINGRELTQEAYTEWLTANIFAYPDTKLTVTELAVRGNEVVVQYRFQGTHEYALGNIPAAHKAVNVEQCIICRFRGELAAEMRQYTNDYGVLVQSGIIPELIHQ